MAEPPRTTRSPGTWALITVLLLVPIAMPLIVPIYAREDPELGGVPFYYWWQFLWVVLAAVMTSAAYLLSKRGGRRGRGTGEDTREGGAR